MTQPPAAVVDGETSRRRGYGWLLLVPGMGHDIPVALHETFVAAIARNAARAAARAS